MIFSIIKQIINPESFTPRTDLAPLPPYVLYQFPECPYCRRVLKVIEDLSLDIPMRNTRSEPSWRVDLKSRTGRTQVPCLFIDGESMFESLDIVAYLKENHMRLPKKSDQS